MSVILRMCKPWHAALYGLRYGSAMPVRVVLAMASWMWALLFFFAPERLSDFHTYSLLLKGMPTWGWGTLFALNGACITWRILDVRNRLEICRIVNASTCALWMAFLYSRWTALGFFTPDTADDVALLFAAVWVTFRTDLTVGDRETA